MDTRFDNLPLTNAALIKHIKRAKIKEVSYGARLFKANNYCLHQNQWGWMKNSDGSLGINWTELNCISDECKELCKCSRKKRLPCKMLL